MGACRKLSDTLGILHDWSRARPGAPIFCADGRGDPNRHEFDRLDVLLRSYHAERRSISPTARAAREVMRRPIGRAVAPLAKASGGRGWQQFLGLKTVEASPPCFRRAGPDALRPCPPLSFAMYIARHLTETARPGKGQAHSRGQR